MRRNRLGCLTGTGLIAGLITLLSIAGYAFISGGLMFNPGPLNAVQGQPLGGVTSHAEIAGECKACHAAPWEAQTMDERCVVCHTDVPAQMTDVSTSHGRMMKITPDAKCRDCHPEHNGADAPLTMIEGWKYPHEASGFFLMGHQLTAANEPFKCADCHGNDVTTFDVKVCATCHNQIDSAFMANHIAAYGTSCLGCHDGVDRFNKAFTHANFAFKLEGKHAPVACEKCHNGALALADFKTASQDCFSCHQADDPHQGALGTDCASCHLTSGWKPANFDHNRSIFKLTDAHAKVACEKCHLDSRYKGTPTDCFSCHRQDDPHQGQFGSDCGSCHKPTNWKDMIFDHAKTAFPLLGKHVSVACENCHKNGIYKGTPKDCASCHVDVHNGQFGKNCVQCHNTADWKDVTFDHSKTAFPLTGLHVGVACKSCHINGVFKGTPKNCFACHAANDVHKGQFGQDCAQCHNTSGWKNVSFDHSKTAFPLLGSHTKVQCTACHVNGVFKGTPANCFACHAQDDAHNGQFGKDCGSCHNPSAWLNVSFDHSTTAFPLKGSHVSVQCKACHVNGVFKGTPKNCFACHAKDDAHNGQFGTNCGSCHNPSAWKNVTFDHSQTAFPLKGKHTTVQCLACHVNGVFKGTPTNCFACHAKDDTHNGQFGTNCGSCHNPSSWQNVTFDHNKTAFPLTGLHTNVQCASCHVNGVYKGTPKDCYSCHADKDAHNGQFGTACESCHNTSGWQNVTFDHNNTAFPLVGLHKNVQCASCHVNGVYKGTPKDCYSCHAANDAHSGSLGTNCGTCHTPNGWKPASFDHNLAAFKLTGMHTTVACVACHINNVYKGTPMDCYSCHAANDAHNGQLGTNCAQCHNPGGWKNVTFDHSTTIFPLTGKHISVSCSSCHVNGQYAGIPTTCAACHAEPAFHAGAFGTDCAQCHTPSAWSPAPYQAHSLYQSQTPMLNHHGATCKTCHTTVVTQYTCLKCHDSNTP